MSTVRHVQGALPEKHMQLVCDFSILRPSMGTLLLFSSFAEQRDSSNDPSTLSINGFI